MEFLDFCYGHAKPRLLTKNPKSKWLCQAILKSCDSTEGVMLAGDGMGEGSDGAAS